MGHYRNSSSPSPYSTQSRGRPTSKIAGDEVRHEEVRHLSMSSYGSSVRITILFAYTKAEFDRLCFITANSEPKVLDSMVFCLLENQMRR
jgi:hypothetical protein